MTFPTKKVNVWFTLPTSRKFLHSHIEFFPIHTIICKIYFHQNLGALKRRWGSRRNTLFHVPHISSSLSYLEASTGTWMHKHEKDVTGRIICTELNRVIRIATKEIRSSHYRWAVWSLLCKLHLLQKWFSSDLDEQWATRRARFRRRTRFPSSQETLRTEAILSDR